MEARSRRPLSNSRAVTAQLRERICTLRGELQRAGLDHRPVSIAARLQQDGIRPPAASTIRRILAAAGLMIPEPKKRRRSSYRRFHADQPNECWQSDFTHHGRTSLCRADRSLASSVLADRVGRHHPRCDPPGVARRTARVSAGGRAVFARATQRPDVQTCGSGEAAPPYGQRVGRLTPSMIRS